MGSLEDVPGFGSAQPQQSQPLEEWTSARRTFLYPLLCVSALSIKINLLGTKKRTYDSNMMKTLCIRLSYISSLAEPAGADCFTWYLRSNYLFLSATQMSNPFFLIYTLSILMLPLSPAKVWTEVALTGWGNKGSCPRQAASHSGLHNVPH